MYVFFLKVVVFGEIWLLKLLKENIIVVVDGDIMVIKFVIFVSIVVNFVYIFFKIVMIFMFFWIKFIYLK